MLDYPAGPLLHCVVWNDGEKWRAAIDTSDLYEANSGKSGEGRLADYEPLTDFEIDQRFATFSAEDACNYGVHIYEDGCILSIVVESGKRCSSEALGKFSTSQGKVHRIQISI